LNAVESPNAVSQRFDPLRCASSTKSSTTSKLINTKRAPPPRILVGELDEPSHEATPRLDGVHSQTSCEHLSSPSVHHRAENRLIRSKQRNVIETQNRGTNPRNSSATTVAVRARPTVDSKPAGR
jgi:hypothetical protein